MDSLGAAYDKERFDFVLHVIDSLRSEAMTKRNYIILNLLIGSGLIYYSFHLAKTPSSGWVLTECFILAIVGAVFFGNALTPEGGPFAYLWKGRD